MSSTVVSHVWHYYNTLLLFFLLPTTTITTTTNTTTTIIAYTTQTQNIQRQQSSQYCAKTMSHIPYRLVILLLRECFRCFLFPCCYCYCYAFSSFLSINSNNVMEFDPIHDVIANSTTFLFVFGVLAATSPSSFVFPTPQFSDKELHPYSFSACSFVLSVLTIWLAKRPDRRLKSFHYNICTDIIMNLCLQVWFVLQPCL